MKYEKVKDKLYLILEENGEKYAICAGRPNLDKENFENNAQYYKIALRINYDNEDSEIDKVILDKFSNYYNSKNNNNLLKNLKGIGTFNFHLYNNIRNISQDDFNRLYEESLEYKLELSRGATATIFVTLFEEILKNKSNDYKIGYLLKGAHYYLTIATNEILYIINSRGDSLDGASAKSILDNYNSGEEQKINRVKAFQLGWQQNENSSCSAYVLFLAAYFNSLTGCSIESELLKLMHITSNDQSSIKKEIFEIYFNIIKRDEKIVGNNEINDNNLSVIYDKIEELKLHLVNITQQEFPDIIYSKSEMSVVNLLNSFFSAYDTGQDLTNILLTLKDNSNNIIIDANVMSKIMKIVTSENIDVTLKVDLIEIFHLEGYFKTFSDVWMSLQNLVKTSPNSDKIPVLIQEIKESKSFHKCICEILQSNIAESYRDDLLEILYNGIDASQIVFSISEILELTNFKIGKKEEVQKRFLDIFSKIKYENSDLEKLSSNIHTITNSQDYDASFIKSFLDCLIEKAGEQDYKRILKEFENNINNVSQINLEYEDNMNSSIDLNDLIKSLNDNNDFQNEQLSGRFENNDNIENSVRVESYIDRNDSIKSLNDNNDLQNEQLSGRFENNDNIENSVRVESYIDRNDSIKSLNEDNKTLFSWKTGLITAVIMVILAYVASNIFLYKNSDNDGLSFEETFEQKDLD